MSRIVKPKPRNKNQKLLNKCKNEQINQNLKYISTITET